MSLRGAGILVFFISFFYLLVGCNIHIEYLDDGAASYGAFRVLSGDIPYKDFMVVSTPAHFYVLAGLFKIFGSDLLVERVWQCVVWASAVTGLYAIAALATSIPLGLLSALMSLVIVGRFPHVAGSLPSTVLFSVLSIYFCLRAISSISSPRRFLPILSGACAGFCVLFRQDIGVYAFLSVFTTFALCHDPAKRQKGDMRKFLAGFFVSVCPLFIYLALSVPFKELFFDLVWFPMRIYPPYAYLPYPQPVFASDFLSERMFYYYFTPLTLIFSILFLFAGWHRPKETSGHSQRFWPKCSLVIAGCLFLSQARFRPDPVHLLPAYLISTVLFSMILASIVERKKIVLLFLVIALVGAFLAPGILTRGSLLFFPKKLFYLNADRARHIGFLPGDGNQKQEISDYELAIQYVREIASPGEEIFVGSTRHDRVCYGDPLFYFLTFTKSATKYQEMHRGVVNTENAQREIMAELERKKIPIVVERKLLDGRCEGEPNASRRADGCKLLDEYLQTHYREEKSFGGNSILRRF